MWPESQTCFWRMGRWFFIPAQAKAVGTGKTLMDTVREGGSVQDAAGSLSYVQAAGAPEPTRRTHRIL